MTLVEFMLLMNAYNLKQEEEWDRTRHMMAVVMNFGGMGMTDPVDPKDIINLRRDNEDKVMPITTIEEARELIEGM